MRKIYILVVIVASMTLLSACRKTCSCTAYDGTTTEYSKAEVDENGGSCSGMIYMFNTRYYSTCSWD
ncbi:MAG: hypothetical protein IJ764_07550 [Bacteroidales bacterium]|nr:hypothetical protein [Bacteroidales bacterium]